MFNWFNKHKCVFQIKDFATGYQIDDSGKRIEGGHFTSAEFLECECGKRKVSFYNSWGECKSYEATPDAQRKAIQWLNPELKPKGEVVKLKLVDNKE